MKTVFKQDRFSFESNCFMTTKPVFGRLESERAYKSILCMQ